MSKSWTPAEIRIASAIMKASGHMSYEEYCQSIAKSQIEVFAKKQRNDKYLCPRCGADKMADDPIRNALSRQADIYVCDNCGMDEALRALSGMEKPLTEWMVHQCPAVYDLRQFLELQLYLYERLR